MKACYRGNKNNKSELKQTNLSGLGKVLGMSGTS